MPSRWTKPVTVVIASALVVAGVIYVGHWARQWLDRRGHFDIALADIQCAAPPDMTRKMFLNEVQYLGGLPDRISTVDPAAVLKVNAAFRGHPWVEHVDLIALRAEGGPRAVLRMRTPVLAVNDRVVDGAGVLLPTGTGIKDLLVFRGSAPEPKGPAGTPWGDATVEGVARAAAALAPFQDRLRLTEVKPVADGLLFSGGVTIGWGSLGDAETKLERLRGMLSKTETLPARIDLGK